MRGHQSDVFVLYIMTDGKSGDKTHRVLLVKTCL